MTLGWHLWGRIRVPADIAAEIPASMAPLSRWGCFQAAAIGANLTMPGDTWRNPHNPPVPLQGHRDSADVSNEAPTADQTRIFVTVDAGAKVKDNDYDYNCLGWVCFKGPATVRAEPDFEFVDNLSEVTAALTKNGYVACPAAEATCIVTGTGPYEIGHVYAKWQGLAAVTDVNWLANWGAVDWWESRLGPAGVTIIHERDALTGNISYSTKLAYFKPQ